MRQIYNKYKPILQLAFGIIVRRLFSHYYFEVYKNLKLFVYLIAFWCQLLRLLSCVSFLEALQSVLNGTG